MISGGLKSHNRKWYGLMFGQWLFNCFSIPLNLPLVMIEYNSKDHIFKKVKSFFKEFLCYETEATVDRPATVVDTRVGTHAEFVDALVFGAAEIRPRDEYHVVVIATQPDIRVRLQTARCRT